MEANDVALHGAGGCTANSAGEDAMEGIGRNVHAAKADSMIGRNGRHGSTRQ